MSPVRTIDLLATPAGLEPATNSLEGCCSIQLSYGAVAVPRPNRLGGQCVHGSVRVNLHRGMHMLREKLTEKAQNARRRLTAQGERKK